VPYDTRSLSIEVEADGFCGDRIAVVTLFAFLTTERNYFGSAFSAHLDSVSLIATSDS
jgi:hypothetical protein